MHEPNVAIVMERAAERTKEAQRAILQVPDELGGVRRDEIEAALIVSEQALMADADSLRGNIASARAFVRRCRFPSEEHLGLFRALAELSYALEDVDQAASAAGYPESEAQNSLSSQDLIPRTSIQGLLTTLESRLAAFDEQLTTVDKLRSGRPEYEDQDALVDYVTRYAGVQSASAMGLGRQAQVDIQGLSHAVTGLGRIVASFVATISAVSARVTDAVRTAARTLGQIARQVVRATADICSSSSRETSEAQSQVKASASRADPKLEVAHKVPILIPFADMDYFIVYQSFGWAPSDGNQHLIGQVLVPKGFVTDMSSAPNYIWSLLPATGRYGAAFIIHDWLYWDQSISRESADRILDIGLQELGLSSIPRKLIWSAVRAFGANAWDTNARAKASGAKRVLKRFPEFPTTTWSQWKAQPDVFA